MGLHTIAPEISEKSVVDAFNRVREYLPQLESITGYIDLTIQLDFTPSESVGSYVFAGYIAAIDDDGFGIQTLVAENLPAAECLTPVPVLKALEEAIKEYIEGEV